MPIYDARGRLARDDGTQSATAEGLRALEKAALPTAREWMVWWKLRERRLMDEGTSGWESALVDGLGHLMDNQLALARRVRLEGAGKAMIRYDSEGRVSGEEMREAEDVTREAFCWWLDGGAREALLKPGTDDTQPGVPEWAGVMAKAIEGCFIQQCRLGIEMTGLKKKGYLVVNASATKSLPTDREIRDEGMAAFGKIGEHDREEA
jgi:hypothetical protein